MIPKEDCVQIFGCHRTDNQDNLQISIATLKFSSYMFDFELIEASSASFRSRPNLSHSLVNYSILMIDDYYTSIVVASPSRLWYNKDQVVYGFNIS